MCVCVCVCLSVCLSVWLAGWLAGWLSGCLAVCLGLRVSVSVSVSVSLVSDSSETIQVIIIKCGMVTASGMGMHHVLIILTMTFVQDHTDLNHEIINV